MRIERVDFVDIPSRDVERSIAFYRDVLGLPQNPREPTEFEAGNVTLAIWKPEDQGVEFPKSSAPLSIWPLPLRSSASHASSDPARVHATCSGTPSACNGSAAQPETSRAHTVASSWAWSRRARRETVAAYYLTQRR